MSMINCPEFKKEISDQAKSCPNCGYVLSHGVTKTELGEKETNPALGWTMIVVGIFAIIIGIFTVSIIIGIFVIMGGLGVAGVGAGKITGMQTGSCPYCSNAVSVKYNATTFKCPHCKKISKKTEKYLEKID